MKALLKFDASSKYILIYDIGKENLSLLNKNGIAEFSESGDANNSGIKYPVF